MRLFFLSLTLLMPGTAAAQDTVSLSPEAAVRLAVEQSPAVRAAESRLEAATAALRGAGAPFNPQGELAPGVGFTNGNALVSQQIDIGGRRAAQARAARGLRSAAEAELALARLRAAAEARAAYFDLVRAREVETAARDAADLARRIRDAVRRRVEIGEAPQVQATRAEIELGRAEQEVARGRGDVQGRLAVLNVLLGRPADAPLATSEALRLPEPPGAPGELVSRARQQRPEVGAAEALVAARRGDVAVARSQRRPELFAEVAADFWSLDRDPFGSRSAGLQARLSFPLFDRGRLRAEEDRARAGVREQEAELASVTRALTVEVERAAADLAAAREIAASYDQTILPRSRELLQATQRGFENGLSSFLEVLEAQRVERQTRTEYLTALFEAVRARTALDRAIGVVPGLAPATEGTLTR